MKIITEAGLIQFSQRYISTLQPKTLHCSKEASSTPHTPIHNIIMRFLEMFLISYKPSIMLAARKDIRQINSSHRISDIIHNLLPLAFSS